MSYEMLLSLYSGSSIPNVTSRLHVTYPSLIKRTFPRYSGTISMAISIFPSLTCFLLYNIIVFPAQYVYTGSLMKSTLYYSIAFELRY